MRDSHISDRRWASWLVRAAIGAALGACLVFAETPALANVAYTYDGLGRLASAAYDNGVTVYYTYDPNGNRLIQSVTTSAAPGVWGSMTWGSGVWG
jgi:YD repeat-containing protein